MEAMTDRLPATADVVVVGAGVVGAACALAAAQAGLRVAVVDRGPIAGGTTGAGEGNLLVSDKAGPELALGLHSRARWLTLAESTLDGDVELETKGGLVVAATPGDLDVLREFARDQRAAGVDAVEVPADALPQYEPHLARDLAGGVSYPQDMQVQPMLATAQMLRAARRLGATVHMGVSVTGIEPQAVRTSRGRVATAAVVNAAGTWAGD